MSARVAFWVVTVTTIGNMDAVTSGILMRRDIQAKDVSSEFARSETVDHLAGGENMPSIGFCVAGGVRTFEYPEVRRRLAEHLFKALVNGSQFTSFFVLGLDTDYRLDENKLNLSGEKLKFWTSTQPSLWKAFSPFNPATVAIYEGTEARAMHGWQWSLFRKFNLAHEENSDCAVLQWKNENSVNLTRPYNTSKLRHWSLQWKKVQACYSMIAEYEDQHEARFDYLVRVRPDLLFVWPSPSISQLGIGSKELIVPQGIVGYGNHGINDHIVVCPRSNCSSYFELHTKYQECRGSLDFLTDDGNQFLANYLRKNGLKIRMVSLYYTIMRDCPVGGECWRLDSKFGNRDLMWGGEPTGTAALQCQALSESICLDPSEELHHLTNWATNLRGL